MSRPDMHHQQTRRNRVRPDAASRVRAVAERLESQIAATADQRTVLLKAFEHPLVVEPHRDHHAYHLGADLFYCGLATGDALPFMGLMSTGPANVAKLLAAAADITPNIYVARLWVGLIDRNRDEYEARGRFVSWQRRWARYKEEADDWAAKLARGDDGSWRDLNMSARQRHLVQDCAILCNIPIPTEMDRGSAHDFLMKNGANVVFRKEF